MPFRAVKLNVGFSIAIKNHSLPCLVKKSSQGRSSYFRLLMTVIMHIVKTNPVLKLT